MSLFLVRVRPSRSMALRSVGAKSTVSDGGGVAGGVASRLPVKAVVGAASNEPALCSPHAPRSRKSSWSPNWVAVQSSGTRSLPQAPAVPSACRSRTRTSDV